MQRNPLTETRAAWAVEAHGLSKSYGQVRSLIDCNLRVPQRCVFGLLGPNGAGKSTLLRTLLGFLKPTAGSALVFGHDILRDSLQVRSHISYLPGDARLYRTLRGRQILELFSGFHTRGSLSASLAVAERLELDLSRRVMFMSTGMRQKLAIALVMGCGAPLLVLDEPTANLDPTVRSEVLAMVREVRDQGRTVLLSSHIFNDIDDTCDHVAILKEGRMVAGAELRGVPPVHIVTGVRNGAPDQEHGLPTRGNPPFVDFAAAEEIGAGAGDVSIELHLSGSPNDWLSWLAEFRLQDVQIEKAGVQALYQRYHRRSAPPERTGEESDSRPLLKPGGPT